MNAEQCRAAKLQTCTRVIEGNTPSGTLELIKTLYSAAAALWEIAAQFAEMNAATKPTTAIPLTHSRILTELEAFERTTKTRGAAEFLKAAQINIREALKADDSYAG